MSLKKYGMALLVAFLVCGWCCSVQAATITSLYGDKDGFGMGYQDGYTHSTWPKPTLLRDDPADANTITDAYQWSDQVWSQTYDLSGLSTLSSASLEIMTYAQGYTGLSSISIGGQLIGTLTDGDTTWESSPLGDKNMVRKDTYDLTPYLASFDGSNTFKIDTVRGDDWWALDYSELTIIGEPVSQPIATPLPGAAWLLGAGLVGFIGLRRRCIPS